MMYALPLDTSTSIGLSCGLLCVKSNWRPPPLESYGADASTNHSMPSVPTATRSWIFWFWFCWHAEGFRTFLHNCPISWRNYIRSHARKTAGVWWVVPTKKWQKLASPARWEGTTILDNAPICRYMIYIFILYIYTNVLCIHKVCTYFYLSNHSTNQQVCSLKPKQSDSWRCKNYS